MGYKPVKRPQSADFSTLSHYLGHGHQNFDDEMITRQLGLGAGALSGMENNELSRGTPVTALSEAVIAINDAKRKEAEERAAAPKEAFNWESINPLASLQKQMDEIYAMITMSQNILDEAVVKCKEAGCAQADIDQALKVHRGVRAAA